MPYSVSRYASLVSDLAPSNPNPPQGSVDLEHIQIIKKVGGKLTDSYLDEGFILDKTIAVNSPKRLENAKILIANTSMDTDKIKIFGARLKVDGTGKLAELERAERVRGVTRFSAHNPDRSAGKNEGEG